MRVLHVSAGPLCQPDLMVTAELRGITDALLPGKARDDTRLEVVPQARPGDLDIYLHQFQPNVLHFSGHGEPQELLLCDDAFDPVRYPTSRLMEALEGSSVKLLILNCCESVEIAREVHENLPIETIGTLRKVLDEEAVIFAGTFYRSLQLGMPLDKSRRLALRELPDWSDEDSYELYTLCARDPARTLLDDQEAASAEGETGGVGAAERIMTRGVGGAAVTEQALGSAQQRTLRASRRLAEIRHGVGRDIRTNRNKLSLALAVAAAASWLIAQPENKPAAEVIAMFSWIKIDPWLLFTFFAAPPLIYLVESAWLKRPLTEAERATFNMAISPPAEDDPEILAERAEMLVAEFEAGKGEIAARQEAAGKALAEQEKSSE